MFGRLLAFTLMICFGLLAMSAAQDMDTYIVPPRPKKPDSTKNLNSTKCYTCDSPNTCRAPATAVCDQESASATHSTLAKYFLDVPKTTNMEFECLKIRHISNKTVQLAVSGCVNVGMNPCKLQPKNNTFISKTCDHCKESLCNPAGNLSSSCAIILSILFGLLLAKCFNA